MTVQVLNLGLPKSGTTTLAKALRRAGLRTADHRIRRRQTEETALHGRYVGDLLYAGYFTGDNPAVDLRGFDAISECSVLKPGHSLWPQTDLALIEAMRRHNPGLKLLASRRRPFEMSQSMLAWSDLGRARLPVASVPGLPPGFGETSKERMQWIEGHYATLTRWFAGDPDFLIYDIEDPSAPDVIGAHIGRALPWWGRANVNPVRRKMQEATA